MAIRLPPCRPPRGPRPAARLCLVLGACLAGAPAGAATRAGEGMAPPAVLQLQAAASAEVVPDRTLAVLAVVAQGSDVAALNSEVLGRLDAALQRARAVSGVQASTGGVATSPRWVDSAGSMHQQGWSVRAELTLRAADPAALGVLLGALASSGLQLQSLGTQMSAAQRERELAELSSKAIAAFRARAQAAAGDFGYSGYRLRNIELGGLQGEQPQPQPLMFGMVNAARPAPQLAVQPAARQVSVSVSGSVQLLPLGHRDPRGAAAAAR